MSLRIWDREAVLGDVVRVIEDLGLQYNFVSYEQIEAGELANYKVLLLPESVAMSAREARAIEEFVRAGGALDGIASKHLVWHVMAGDWDSALAFARTP